MRHKLIFFLYRILQATALPFLVPYVIWRGIRDSRYFATISQRFGRLPGLYKRTLPDSLWLHAVSVGEVLSSVELIKRLRHELPESPIFVSCSTLAGREAADSRLAPLVDGVFYAPFDYVFAIRCVLRRIRPAVVIVLETEIWPNLYRETKKSGAALVIVNGRISRKTTATYSRWRWFFRGVLAHSDAILAQSALDREHYIQAGADPGRVYDAGNLKYDFDPKTASPPPEVAAFLDRCRGPVWVAASTVAPEYEGDVDEDDATLDAFVQLRAKNPELTLIIAPRKPERFDIVAAKLERTGIIFERRSQLTGTPVPVLLLDSIGELSSVFPRADVVFMGGTLAHRGGHNILEPAIFARPIIVGPHLENFAEIERRFVEAKAFLRIADAGELAAAVAQLLSDPGDLGVRAKRTAETHRGATSRAVATIVDLRWSAIPRAIPRGPLKPALYVLAWLWRRGGESKRASALRSQRSLSTPVISVGGIAMGGVGKTPFVAWLARGLHERGYRPAILTRGYKRSSPERVTILAAGATAATEITGDEGQILLRTGIAPLGISADRYLAGLEVEKQFRPDVFLLDDGFQHARLARDLDVVLLDGLDPFTGGDVFPLGRLREPVEALSRAGAIVISRADGRRFDGLLKQLPDVPVFLSSVKPVAWRTGAERLPLDALAGKRMRAFCGLANPATFWATLRDLGCDVVERLAFADHHRYLLADMKDIAAPGVDVIVTTQKDAMNLPSDCTAVYWLEIDITVEPESALFTLLLKSAPRMDLVDRQNLS